MKRGVHGQEERQRERPNDQADGAEREHTAHEREKDQGPVEVRTATHQQRAEHVVEQSDDDEHPGGQEHRPPDVAEENHHADDRNAIRAVPTDGMKRRPGVSSPTSSGLGTPAM